MDWGEIKDFEKDVPEIISEIVKEKRIKVKPIKDMDWVNEIYLCPDCGDQVRRTKDMTMCGNCGKYLDWSEE